MRGHASNKDLDLIGAQAREKGMHAREPTIRYNMRRTRHKHK